MFLFAIKNLTKKIFMNSFFRQQNFFANKKNICQEKNFQHFFFVRIRFLPSKISAVKIFDKEKIMQKKTLPKFFLPICPKKLFVKKKVCGTSQTKKLLAKKNIHQRRFLPKIFRQINYAEKKSHPKKDHKKIFNEKKI